MMTRMFYRLGLVVGLSLALAGPALPQSSRNLSIRPDLRLFTMMTALNAAGYDVELASQYHPMRQLVRDAASGLDPDLVQRLRTFYQNRKGAESDDAQLAKYISLAVSLTDAPEFGVVLREENLPPDARGVMGFVELLREVYTQARVSSLWAQVRPQYELELNRMAVGIREALLRADAYMRVPLGGFGPRNMAIYVELAAPVNSVNVRSYQDNYHVVLGPATSPKIDDIRHAYLHFHLDNLVAINVGKIQGSTTLLPMLAGRQGVQRGYTSDLYVMVVESLIRALELRMDRTPAAEAKTAVDAFYRTGLLLTPYFYESMENYETKDLTLRTYFPEMAEGVQIATERARFETSFAKIPVPANLVNRAEVPQPEPVPVANPVRELLRRGESAFNNKDIEEARAAFQQVLEAHDAGNGAALYGMALIASSEGMVDEAKDYLNRTVNSPSAEPSMNVWAYIYLGRIHDLECDREKAVEFYNQAIRIGDNTRNAQAVASQGLTKPFGDACR